MRLHLPAEVARGYKSPSQRARVMTQAWGRENLYCPACPSETLEATPEGMEVVDFSCPRCELPYQLKAKSGPFGRSVVNSAYGPKIRAIMNGTAPNYLFMRYDLDALKVQDLFIVPRHFLSPDIIEKRAALKATARRAGWVGSNILLHRLPPEARVSLIDSGLVVDPRQVRDVWKQFSFFRELSPKFRGWTSDVLLCVRRIGKDEFALGDLYRFETELERLHPQNRNVRPKIRQQLQILRDFGVLKFEGDGRYRLVR